MMAVKEQVHEHMMSLQKLIESGSDAELEAKLAEIRKTIRELGAAKEGALDSYDSILTPTQRAKILVGILKQRAKAGEDDAAGIFDLGAMSM